MAEAKDTDSNQEKQDYELVPLRGWRKTLAARMLTSHLEHATVTQMREVAAGKLVTLRNEKLKPLANELGVKISYTHLLIKVAAQALKQHPNVNSSMTESEIHIYNNINIAMAVALENGGLLAPVIRNADEKTIVEIAREAVTIAEKVRSRRFDLDMLKGGTFTVTNAGMYGTDFVTPLITGAQCAALGIGRLMEKPVVKDKEIVIGTTMGLSITYDHRIITGATAAQYFQTVQDLIEHPKEIDLKI